MKRTNRLINRRGYLSAVLLAGTACGSNNQDARPIELNVDLDVDPAREQELLTAFRTQFRPAISKQPGFLEVKLLRFVSTVQGAAPVNVNYRLLISFQSEAQRRTWVETPLHQKVWPSIERTLRGGFSAYLFEVV
ncbi:MAG: hypothetical protein M1541_14045 [Acidobacteria bacterium]|nr:hypothetical protein [Acidobacteriota bacterium]